MGLRNRLQVFALYGTGAIVGKHSLEYRHLGIMVDTVFLKGPSTGWAGRLLCNSIQSRDPQLAGTFDLVGFKDEPDIWFAHS